MHEQIQIWVQIQKQIQIRVQIQIQIVGGRCKRSRLLNSHILILAPPFQPKHANTGPIESNLSPTFKLGIYDN